jgi:copper(I)-binding protein
VKAAPGSSRRIGIGAVAVAMLTLTGCAAGQDAQTANVVPVVDGVTANAGPVALRAVTVTAPTDGSFAPGSDAALQLVIVNDGQSADRLVGVTTPQADQVRFYRNGIDAGTASSESSTSESPSSISSETPSRTPSSSAPADLSIDSISLPPSRAISIGYSSNLPVIQLHGIKSQLFPAMAFPITFQFASAGSVTFSVAVHLTTGAPSTPTVDISPTDG